MAKTNKCWFDEAASFTAADFSKLEARVGAYMTRQQSGFIYLSRQSKWIQPRGMKPMFTKQHYESVAKLLSSQKDDVRKTEHLSVDERDEQLNVLNETTMRFVHVFKRDNPKFKDLLFIGACDAGISTEPRQK